MKSNQQSIYKVIFNFNYLEYKEKLGMAEKTVELNFDLLYTVRD